MISSSEFKLSRNGLSVRYNQMVKEYTNQAKMYGMSFSQMAQANGMNEPAMKEYIYDSVEEAAKRELTVEAVAANEGLDQITDEDRELFAQENGMSKDTLINMYGQEQADEYVLQDKVLYYLASNAVNEAENPGQRVSCSGFWRRLRLPQRQNKKGIREASGAFHRLYHRKRRTMHADLKRQDP